MIAHSRLSASGSSIWLACPASVKLSEKAPPKTTHPSALVGTVAHSVCESALAFALGNAKNSHAEMLGEEINGIFVDREMINSADIYVDFIMSIYADGDDIKIEERVTLEHIHPDMFGTADCIITKADGSIHVVDYKNGQYPVKVKENSQLIYYALGAMKNHTPDYCTINVVQPRSSDGDMIKSWTFPRDQFAKWEQEFKSKAEMADIGTPMVKGKHCLFAACKAICPLHLPR